MNWSDSPKQARKPKTLPGATAAAVFPTACGCASGHSRSPHAPLESAVVELQAVHTAAELQAVQPSVAQALQTLPFVNVPEGHKATALIGLWDSEAGTEAFPSTGYPATTRYALTDDS